MDPHSARSQGSYRALLWAVAALALAVMGWRLGLEVHRLLFQPGGPVDWGLYRQQTRDWFDQVPLSVGFRNAVHLPGAYLFLWPLMGWGDRSVALGWHAATTAVAIGLFAALLLREARPASWLDRLLLAALIVASYPAAVTIGNGQITFHVLLAALAGVLLARRAAPGVRRDAALALLFAFALVKPHLSLPFFWAIAFTRGWRKPVLLAGVAYLAATAAAIALHGDGIGDVPAILASWLVRSSYGAVTSGYGNLHVWLQEVGLGDWAFRASGVAFALHGLWAWRHRAADPWILIGVAAIVARLWAYHRLYDDLLLLLPLVVLYRLARGEAPAPGAWALFLLGAVTLVAPITPILEAASWAVVTVWLLQLGYLAWRARNQGVYRGRATPLRQGPGQWFAE